MKVFYDFQIIAAQKYGGISRYFFELYSGLKSLGVDARVSCVRSMNYYFREQFKMHDSLGRNRIVRSINWRFLPKLNRINALIRMRNCDIIHPTYYNYYMQGRYSGKLVVTVHDMIHEIFNGDKPTIA